MHKKEDENKQKGATAVELAIVLPILILFIFAIIEFSLLLYNQTMITNSAREGARLGVVWAPKVNDTSYRVTREEIIAETQRWLGNNLISFDSAVARITPDDPEDMCQGTGLGQVVTVRVEYDYSFLVLPLDPITLSSEANMSCESIQDAT